MGPSREREIQSSLFIGAFMTIHSFGPSTGWQRKCFIDLINAIHSKVYFKASFKIVRALTGPKLNVFDSTWVTYWVATHFSIPILNVLGKETLITPKTEPWHSKDSGMIGLSENKWWSAVSSVLDNCASSESFLLGCKLLITCICYVF